MNAEEIQKGIEDMKERLTVLFHEMLDYKHKEYDENLPFDELLQLTSMHYNYKSGAFLDAYYAVKFKSVYEFPSLQNDNLLDDQEEMDLTDAEVLAELELLYGLLTETGNDYKVHAQDDVDINLAEGQTLKELSKEYIEKFIPLFYEMLDFVNVSYDKEKDNTFFSLWFLITKEYPWYYDILFNLEFIISSDLDSSYVDIINACDTVYHRLLNYQEDYQEYLVEYGALIEDHKAWLAEEKATKEYNETVLKQKQASHLYEEEETLRKECRKNPDNTELQEKLAKTRAELKKKFPYRELRPDPFDEIRFQNQFDVLEEIEDFEEED